MPAKAKNLTETQFLALLDKVLAKIMSDLNLRAAIQDEVAKEIRVIRNLAEFTKFAEKGSVPDVGPETVAQLQEQLAAGFGGDAKVEVTPDEENEGRLAVEITLPDRTVSSQIKVDPTASGEGADGEPTAPFVPFPVTLPQDPELVWVLARRENVGPDEAARALSSIEQEFWASKGGQQRLRKGGERTFAEFIAAVPSAALLESGLKRHYKEPETIHALQLLGASGAGGEAPAKPERKPEPASASLDHLFAPAGEGKKAVPEADDEDEGPAWD